MRQDVRLFFSLLLTAVAGCQGQTPPPNPPVKSAPAALSDAGGAPAEGATEPNAPSAEPDPAPVAAVKAVLHDVEAGQLEALADFLPASYVQELESLLRSAVEKTPEDLWQRFRSIAGKLRQLIEDQPQIVAGNSGEHRRQLAAVLDSLAGDAAWDRKQWKSVELKSLLRAPAAKLLAERNPDQPANPSLLSQTDVRLVTIDGDQATLQLQSPLDTEPRTVEFVEREGKWIPKPLAETWTATIGQAAGWLSSVSEEELAKLSQHLGPVLLQVEGTLDQMIRADRPEEVQLGWWQIQSLLIQARQDLLEPGPPPHVELRLAADLADEQLTDLLQRLIDATDRPEAGEYLTFPAATGTIIQVSPVSDVDEFVKRLTFVTVKSSDAEGRTIDIDIQ